jgi:hypothetical protein
MVKPPLRTKSIGFKVSEEEYAQLETAAQTGVRPPSAPLPTQSVSSFAHFAKGGIEKCLRRQGSSTRTRPATSVKRNHDRPKRLLVVAVTYRWPDFRTSVP